MRDWESSFSSWSTGPGKAESDRIENAERMIREAIRGNDKLQKKSVQVFVQGSYRNNVNVRQDSDIDIGVVCSDTFFPEYSTDELKSKISPTLDSATYFFHDFKRDLEEALVDKFGRSSVTRGNKSFNISANTYRIDADVTPFFEYRYYTGIDIFEEGVKMITDKGIQIVNWPEQHYNNGVIKNTNTQRRYKRAVRIFKKLSTEMASVGIKEAELPGFLIECLIWNVHNEIFNHSTHTERVKNSIVSVYHATKDVATCNNWGEVNELKYLFRPSQFWTREQANAFMHAAWNYLGFK